MRGFLLYKDDLSTVKILYFYSEGQVLSTIEVRLLVLAADPHLAAGGWGVGLHGGWVGPPGPV